MVMEASGKTNRNFDSWYFIKDNQYIKWKKKQGLGHKKVSWAMGHGYQGKRLLALGYLIAPTGDWWRVRSGGNGSGALPDGFYSMDAPRRPWTKVKMKGGKVRFDLDAFTDTNGNRWFCPIWNNYTDKYGNEDLLGRGAFGIHPDGGVFGTSGCIGVISPNTKNLYNLLKATKIKKLIVRDVNTTNSELIDELDFIDVGMEV